MRGFLVNKPSCKYNYSPPFSLVVFQSHCERKHKFKNESCVHLQDMGYFGPELKPCVIVVESESYIICSMLFGLSHS